MAEYPLSNRTEFGIQNDTLRYSWAAYYIFILLSSLIGDTAILVASLKYRVFRKLHHFIVEIINHIAVCDLMVSIVSVFPRVVSLIADGWVFGDAMRYLTAYGVYYFNIVSLLLISVMTTSKLLLLRFPMRTRDFSSRKSQVVCMTMWAIATTSLVLVLLVDRNVDALFDHRTYDCRLDLAGSWKWLKPILVGVFALIPNIVVVATTVHLLIIARSIVQRGGDSLKWQGIITTIVVAVVYCISILPYTIYTFIGYSGAGFAEDPHSFFRTHYNRVVKSFIFINTFSNFYIYSMTVASFREFLWSSKLNLLKHCVSSKETPSFPLQSSGTKSSNTVSGKENNDFSKMYNTDICSIELKLFNNIVTWAPILLMLDRCMSNTLTFCIVPKL